MAFMDLFRPKWKHSDWRVRKAAVAEINDQNILARIALYDNNSDVSLAAAEKLTDQTLLAELALNVQSDPIREMCIKRLTDQMALARIAKSGVPARHRFIAAEKLTDQILLTEIAKNDKDAFLRLAAAEKLTDQTLAQSIFTDLAKPDGDIGMQGDLGKLRLAAADKLTDRTLAQSMYDKMDQERAKNDTEFKRRTQREEQIQAEMRKGRLREVREENCHHEIVYDPEGFCDFCKCFTHTGKYRICGHVQPHTCT